MVRERKRVQQAIAVSAVTLPVSTGMRGAICMASLYVQGAVQVKGNFATPAILTECYSLNPARIGQMAEATRQAVKCR